MNKQNFKRRVLSIILTLAMVATYLPLSDLMVTTVKAETRSVVDLNIGSSGIAITGDGYTYEGNTVTYKGDYVISGESDGIKVITVNNYKGTITLNGVSISSWKFAPISVIGDCDVNFIINDAVTLKNSGTDSTEAYNWPGLYISGDEGCKVQITGNGQLTAAGGKGCPGIGGGCTDLYDVYYAREAYFNSELIFDGPTVNAKGGSYAPAIGTGRACDVGESSRIEFKSGNIIAKSSSNGCAAIGVSSIADFDDNMVPERKEFDSKLTLVFSGANADLVAGTAGAAIGAGKYQDAYKVYITGGNITATGGSSCPAIGGGGSTNHIDYVEITGGNLNLSSGQSAPAIGSGKAALATESAIVIKSVAGSPGPTIIAKSSMTEATPIFANTTLGNNDSEWVDMQVRMNYFNSDDSDESAVRIPYTECKSENYLLDGFNDEDGTYYTSVVKGSLTAARGKTASWLCISPCTDDTHDYVYKPDADNKNEHTRVCKYCNHQSPNENHEWEYTSLEKDLFKTCTKCGKQYKMSVKDSEIPFDHSTHEVELSGDTDEIQYDIKYYSAKDRETPLTSLPKAAGEYIAVVATTDGDASVSCTIKINEIPMVIHANGIECEFDNSPHSIAVSVTDPNVDIHSYTLSYSTDGVSYSSTLPTFTTVGKHITYYKVEAESYEAVVGYHYVTITPQKINGLTVTGLSLPAADVELDTSVNVTSGNVATPNPSIYWVDAKKQEATGLAKYNMEYTGSFTVAPDKTGYIFNPNITKTDIKISPAIDIEEVLLNSDGLLTVKVKSKTEQDSIESIAEIVGISGLRNGTEKSVTALGLPSTVEATTKGGETLVLSITWDVDGCSYDPAIESAQTFTVHGRLTAPDEYIFPESLQNVSIEVSVNNTAVKPLSVDIKPGTYKEDKVIHLSTETDAAQIWYKIVDVDTEYKAYSNTTGIRLTGMSGHRYTYTIEAYATKSGLDDSPKVTYEYVINQDDVTPPDITIHIEDDSDWTSFFENITFNLIKIDPYTVSMDIDDGTGSGVKSLEYLISDEVMSLTELDSSTEWKTYDAPFTISDKGKYIVYAKGLDNYDNVTYVNTDGMLIYVNSAAVTKSVSVVPKVDQSVDFYVALNGNTVKELRIDDKVVPTDMYTVNEKSGMITLHDEAFNDLDYSKYTITISYNPLGMTYVNYPDNVAPQDTSLSLSLIKPKLLSVGTVPDITDVPNGTSMEVIASMLPTAVTVVTEDASVTSLPLTWNTDTFAEGTYDPYVLEAQSFVLNGTVQLPDSVQRNDVPLTVRCSVSVLGAGTLSAPSPTMDSGSYLNEVTVGLYSPEGATIYYTLDGTVPTLESAIYKEPFTIVTSTTIKAICHLDGMYDSPMLSAYYTITHKDETAPLGKITVGSESIWDKLTSFLKWEFFTTKSQTVTISGEDPESGIKAIFYYLSPKELTLEELEDVNHWERYVSSLHLDPNTGGILYAKIINGDGLYSYVNTNGIVIYTNAEAVSDKITYVKGSKSDLTFIVKLNGNSVRAVRNGTSPLANTYYSQTSDGSVILSANYLEMLNTGNYTLNVDYNPLGISNADAKGSSIEPTSTSVSLFVTAVSTIPDTSGSSGSGTGGGTGTTIPIITQDPTKDLEGGTDTTNVYTDASGVKHEKVTAIYSDKSTTVTDTSKDKTGNTTVVVTEKTASGATTNVSTRIQYKDGGESYTVVEYLSSTVTKTTTNKVDSKGNTYKRDYLANKDDTYTENITSVTADVKTSDKYKVAKGGVINQTYSSLVNIDGKEIKVDITGSGTQTAPKYVETYSFEDPALNDCSITVKRSNSSAVATAKLTKVNSVGNTCRISEDLVDELYSIASLNNKSGKLTNVSTIHDFGTKRSNVDSVDVTYKVTDEEGNKRCTLLFTTGSIYAGAKIRMFRYTKGNYVMLGSSYTTVPESGTLVLNPKNKYTYRLVNPSTYKVINEKIMKTAKFTVDDKSVGVNKTVSTKMSSKLDKRNVKSITYSTKNKKIATVSSSGKVTGKKKGKTTLTATVKFVNGGSKKVTMTINVK